MGTNAARSVVVFLLLALPLSAHAVFHLWKLTEAYSNADGTVQYVQLGVDANGEHLVRGHALFSQHAGGKYNYIFPRNLPSASTAGRKMLVATEGFAALGLLTPDYVVPNGFLSRAGGVLLFAELDNWNYPALPAGAQALRRDGSVVEARPFNFAGESALVPAVTAAPNYQGLWWASPAGSESGWGVNLTHQGDILFVTWFTYDVDGSGMWLVGSDVRKTAAGTYTGALYRTTGPAFSAVPFDASTVKVTPVGSVTFTFTDESTGSFAYTVGEVSRTKPIVRQVFSSPVPQCRAAGAVPATGAVRYQDLWWNAGESGWGVNLTHQGDILFATWFTYGADGRGQWLVMSEARLGSSGAYTGTIFRTRGPAWNSATWDGNAVTVTPAGTGTFTFTGPDSGTFAYTLDGVTQVKPITRQAYSTPATVCQ